MKSKGDINKVVDLYKKYYLEEEVIKRLLQEGIVVFDTSALLDLYYYSEKTRNEIFEKVFTYLKDRLWISAQVYFEYLKNKSVVSQKPINSYKNLISKSDKVKDGGYADSIVELTQKIDKDIIKNIRGQFKTLQEKTKREDKHPYFPSDIYEEYEKKLFQFEATVMDFMKSSNDFKDLLVKKVDERIKEFEAVDTDTICQAVENHFQIGKELSYSEMMEIAKEGAFRYEELIPPGYKDADEKIGLQKYGDLFAWKQILMHANKSKKGIILVINDVKEDWFEDDKKTPRYELLREFNTVVNKPIWLMPMSYFLYQINTLLDSQLDTNTIDDVENVFENRTIRKISEEDLFEAIQGILSQVFHDEIYLIDQISINSPIRIFDRPLLYEAEDEEGKKYRIVANVLGGAAYAKALHAITNAFEIKKFYDSNGEIYKYYNFIILENKGLLDRFEEHLIKKKVKNGFNNKMIKSIICYCDDEGISVTKTNFSKG